MSNSESTKWSGRAARRLIAVLLLVAPLEQVGFDIYTPALPKIAAHFAASNALVQNTVTAYMLGMALVVLPAGLIADAIGRKRVLLSGLGLMVATSIGCAVADSLPLMIGLRFLGGMGAGTCLLLAAAIAADCFRGAKLVSVLGILGAAWGAAPVVSPAVGGFIVQFGSWRLVFVVLAALTAAVAADGTNCLVLSQHGCVVMADSVELAHKRARNLEEAATLTYRALAAGRLSSLRECPEEFLDRLSMSGAVTV